MNYNEFMKVVEEKLFIMSEEEKTKWIYNKARIAKEHERSGLLNSLGEEPDYDPIIYEKNKIENWCEKIEEGDIYFECSGYEEYGENYWDGDYAYDYYDPFDIVEDLYDAFQMAEDLLYQKRYQESQNLNNLLLNLTFIVSDRDTVDWNELDFEEVVDEIWTNFNYERVVLNLMYATYQITKGKDRFQSLYSYLIWNKSKNIKIEDIFRIGPEELKDIDSFMEEWISFLIDTDGDRAAELLLEACLYKGIDYLCEIARTKYLRHPILFKYACEDLLSQNKDVECEKLGLEAVDLLSENLIIRGEIADLTAIAAINLKHYDIAEKCYEASFYSKSSLNNYLRLFQISNYENITKKAAKHVEKLSEDDTGGFNNINKQININTLSRNHKDIIRFFNGEFDYIYDIYIKEKYSLGWTTRFKGIVIPLFILLLNKDKKSTKAIEKLVEGIIYRLEFVGEDVDFLDLFLNWREKQVLTEEQYEKYISWLKDETDKRTEGVVGGCYRNSYYKAAVLIASLGETLESNGMTNGRAIIIEHYRKAHSRKRAFKAEFELLNK
jgi:hypothetical protein